MHFCRTRIALLATIAILVPVGLARATPQDVPAQCFVIMPVPSISGASLPFDATLPATASPGSTVTLTLPAHTVSVPDAGSSTVQSELTLSFRLTGGTVISDSGDDGGAQPQSSAGPLAWTLTTSDNNVVETISGPIPPGDLEVPAATFQVQAGPDQTTLAVHAFGTSSQADHSGITFRVICIADDNTLATTQDGTPPAEDVLTVDCQQTINGTRTPQLARAVAFKASLPASVPAGTAVKVTLPGRAIDLPATDFDGIPIDTHGQVTFGYQIVGATIVDGSGDDGGVEPTIDGTPVPWSLTNAGVIVKQTIPGDLPPGHLVIPATTFTVTAGAEGATISVYASEFRDVEHSSSSSQTFADDCTPSAPQPALASVVVGPPPPLVACSLTGSGKIGHALPSTSSALVTKKSIKYRMSISATLADCVDRTTGLAAPITNGKVTLHATQTVLQGAPEPSCTGLLDGADPLYVAKVSAKLTNVTINPTTHKPRTSNVALISAGGTLSGSGNTLALDSPILKPAAGPLGGKPLHLAMTFDQSTAQFLQSCAGNGHATTFTFSSASGATLAVGP